MRLENGCTCRLVPITISRSQVVKSGSKLVRNLSGRSSPKKTMSGFMIPVEQDGHTAGRPDRMSASIWYNYA